MRSYRNRASVLALPVPTALPRPRWSPYLIWLVPAVVILLGASVVMRAVSQRGPTVSITFASAEGLEAHKTTIRYKGVVVGSIKAIELSAGRSSVVVTCDLSSQMAGLLVEDARFWVVRPRVSAAGVSGMGTLLTGAHVGFDAGVSVIGRREFVGLESAPSTISDRRGTRFTLRAENVGSLDVGAPVFLRRFQVGQVTGVALDGDGGAVKLDVFVDAPHDAHVTTNTRFWNASGMDLTVDTRGIKLDTQSLASMLMGGIAFESPPADDNTASSAAAAGTVFLMHPDRKSALRGSPGIAAEQRLVFHRPVRGLSVGAPVTLWDLEIGDVARVDVDFDATTMRPRTVVTVNLHPERIRMRQGTNAAPTKSVTGTSPQTSIDARTFFGRMVDGGLRAQVRAGNLLTGQRYVAFDWVPHARPAIVNWNEQPVTLPTWESAGASDVEDLPQSLARLVTKTEKMIEHLPLEELAREGTLTAREMRRTLQQTAAVMTLVNKDLAPRMVTLLGQTERTLASAERTFASDAPLQQDLRAALRDLSGAGYAVRTLAETLERHPESLLRGKKSDPKQRESSK